MNKLFLFCFFALWSLGVAQAQSPTCAYPTILLHGWTGSNESWSDFYEDADVASIFGTFDTDDHVFWAMPNATNTHDYYIDCCTFFCFFDCEYVVDSTINDNIEGPDGIFNNNATDDDVQWVFPNENNVLLPGCLYAYSFNVGKNNDGTIFKNSVFTSTAPCNDCSDNNEAAAYKQGYALKRVIEAVLAANPTKDKVVLAAHSMGGLCGREYLQRRDANGHPQWWVDSTAADGHKVAKFITLGTPHRGSNTLGNLTLDEHHNRNDFPDLQSEGLRDLRYSYEDGSLADDIPGTYLYGGLESDVPSFLFEYWSIDVNCDGDDDDEIIGINENGLNQGMADVWDGTIDNPLMPLPTNIKYTYYVSDADGAVDDARQWIFLGGDGDSGDYNAGTSVSVPFDGVNHRRSDRINVSRFHLNQTDDIANVIRAMDEADYADMAYEIDRDIWYYGLAQQRADQVPLTSEWTLTGNEFIDGDWYFIDLLDTVYQFHFDIIPHPALTGRVDFYSFIPDLFSNNAVADTSISWSGGSDTLHLSTAFGNYPGAKYYFRITHDLNSATTNINDLWKSPYYFHVNMTEECEQNLLITGELSTATFRVEQQINTNAIIGDSAQVEFQAATSINLLPGFETEASAQFHAKIDSCSSP
jgi:pimeloyl-ACP methyl ester carboxylesterase